MAGGTTSEQVHAERGESTLTKTRCSGNLHHAEDDQSRRLQRRRQVGNLGRDETGRDLADDHLFDVVVIADREEGERRGPGRAERVHELCGKHNPILDIDIRRASAEHPAIVKRTAHPESRERGRIETE